MPTPVAHTLAGACVAALAARGFPAARVLPVAGALLVAANLPDTDYLALVRGREAMAAFHQGVFHSIGFIAAATLPLALLLRRRLPFTLAWLLLAGAGLTHLLLDLLVVDTKPPVGFPFFWPLTGERYHSPISLFPGIDRTVLFGRKNLLELLAELAWGLPALPLLRWLPWRASPAGAR
jgi:membrane-bound metal-dependent hydrolase YbcI (DUF457 family)